MKLRLGIEARRPSALRTARALAAPILVSANSLWDNRRRTWRGWEPLAEPGTDVALDSGGFVAMKLYGGYRWTVPEYVTLAAHLQPTWWAQMDFCCEPELAPDRAGVRTRIRRTVEHLEECRRVADGEGAPPPLPVLQGWRPDDYCHGRIYDRGEWPSLVGIGSVCRRPVHGPTGILAILEALNHPLPLATAMKKPAVTIRNTYQNLWSVRHWGKHKRTLSSEAEAQTCAEELRRQLERGKFEREQKRRRWTTNGGNAQCGISWYPTGSGWTHCHRCGRALVYDSQPRECQPNQKSPIEPMKPIKRYSLAYWLKHKLQFVSQPEAIIAATVTTPPADLDLDGTALERLNALYLEWRKWTGSVHGCLFPTPLAVAAQLAEFAGVTPDDTVFDPGCGLGNLLHAAVQRGAKAFGVETQHWLPPLAGTLQLQIARGDYLNGYTPGPFTCVLTNPPYGHLWEYTDVAARFLERLAGQCPTGTRVGAILPANFLDSTKPKARLDAIAKFSLLDRHPLPLDTFQPLTNTATEMVLLRRNTIGAVSISSPSNEAPKRDMHTSAPYVSKHQPARSLWQQL